MTYLQIVESGEASTADATFMSFLRIFLSFSGNVAAAATMGVSNHGGGEIFQALRDDGSWR